MDSQQISLTSCFRNWNDQLVQLAAGRLSPNLRKHVDPEDIVQSVFRTVWRRQEAGSIELAERPKVWQLFKRIVTLKACKAARYHRAACRDQQREVRNVDVSCQSTFTAKVECKQIIALMKEGLSSTHGKMLDLRLEGHSVAYIATELGVARQTVYRGLQLLHDRFESLSGNGEWR